MGLEARVGDGYMQSRCKCGCGCGCGNRCGNILRNGYHKLRVLLVKEELSEGGIADSKLKKQ